MPVAAAAAPRCFICEEAIEPGEPFKPVQAYVRVQASPELPPQRGTVRVDGAHGFRIVTRGVHYSCELEAIAAAGAVTGEPPVIDTGDDDDDHLTTREKLSRLMGAAVDLVDSLDELL